MNPIMVKGIRFFVDSLLEGGYQLRAVTNTPERQTTAASFAKFAGLRVIDSGQSERHIFEATIRLDDGRRLADIVNSFNKSS